ncbi:hypothetical protein MTR67_045698 [Solanum verrucosum]|uniref:Nuclear factor related to kappa-B-binding protein second winged helix domain-containing protein n=1 Tax=Solanum verrucosum TaxID=315347 RepID=A0AAF0USR3_SOLVR|nr:hypothetical protein MTR67_045698 [Solanum verrucosum]
MTVNTSDDMPYKEVNRAAKILMQMANVVNQPQPNKDTNNEEIRACFRREEALRYREPERAFSYTTIDGHKSVVAPLKRRGGKPLKRILHHHILKTNRPTHFSLHCLVRDAAARLPGGVRTRDDVCVLARDSQFIVEDISSSQLNKAVRGGSGGARNFMKGV